MNSQLSKIDLNNADLSGFSQIFLSISDKHAPKIQKFIPANSSNFVTKNLRKSFMKKTKLGNKYLRQRTNETKSLYNKHKKFLRKNKKDYFGNLNNKIVSDNRTFWKTISPLFSEKSFCREYATLKESNQTIRNNEELAETFNTFLSKIVPNFKIDNYLVDNITNPHISDPVFCTFSKLRK